MNFQRSSIVLKSEKLLGSINRPKYNGGPFIFNKICKRVWFAWLEFLNWTKMTYFIFAICIMCTHIYCTIANWSYQNHYIKYNMRECGFSLIRIYDSVLKPRPTGQWKQEFWHITYSFNIKNWAVIVLLHQFWYFHLSRISQTFDSF